MASNGNNALIPATRFTEEQRELALGAVAMASGNTRAAEDFLKREGLQIDHSTLYQWTHGKYADRYAQLRAKVLPEVRARLADRMEQLFHREADLEEKALDELEAKLKDLTGHELSTAVRNLAVSRSLSVEKSAPIRGEATHVIETDRASIERALAKHGFVIEVAESDVQELPETQLERKETHA